MCLANTSHKEKLQLEILTDQSGSCKHRLVSVKKRNKGKRLCGSRSPRVMHVTRHPSSALTEG